MKLIKRLLISMVCVAMISGFSAFSFAEGETAESEKPPAVASEETLPAPDSQLSDTNQENVISTDSDVDQSEENNQLPVDDLNAKEGSKKTDNPASADDQTKDPVNETQDQNTTKVSVDGEYISFSETDGYPYRDEKAWRTMIPFRKVAETLGAAVAWRESDRSVHVFRDGVCITLYIDKTEMEIGKFDVVSSNGYITALQYQNLDAAPVIDEKIGRTFVPYRVICEALGFDVDWNDSTKTAIVTNPKGKEDTQKGSGHNENMALGIVDYKGMFGGGYLGVAEPKNYKYGAVKINVARDVDANQDGKGDILGGGSGAALIQGNIKAEKVGASDENGTTIVKNGYTFLEPGEYTIDLNGKIPPKGYAINKNATSFTVSTDNVIEIDLLTKVVTEINIPDEKKTLTIGKGEKEQISVTFAPEGAIANVKCVSSDQKVASATYDEKNGILVTAHNYGKTKITIKETGNNAEQEITVIVPVKVEVGGKIEVPTGMTAGDVGRGRNIEYTSSNDSIARWEKKTSYDVTYKNTVIGIKEGETQLKWTYGKTETIIPVVVTKPEGKDSSKKE